jgi:soluble P-type ATPase
VLKIDVPNFAALRLEHLVLDYNGTVAVDGRLLPGVAPRLRRLAAVLSVHIVTADTFGMARRELRGLPCKVTILGVRAHDRAKAAYVRKLMPPRTACIGNGRNDRLMLRACALGIAVILAEGAAAASLRAADVVVTDIRDALDLLLHPQRLVATLRS